MKAKSEVGATRRGTVYVSGFYRAMAMKTQKKVKQKRKDKKVMNHERQMFEIH